MHSFFYIEITEEPQINFDNQWLVALKDILSTPYFFDLDNFSDPKLIELALQQANESESVSVCIQDRGGNKSTVIGFLNKLTKMKCAHFIINHEDPVFKKIGSFLFDHYKETPLDRDALADIKSFMKLE